MIWLLLAACGPHEAPAPAPVGERVPDLPAPDVAQDRLCDESADPEAAVDTTHLRCRLETFRFADEDATADGPLLALAFNLERGYTIDAVMDAFDRGDLPLPDLMVASELDRGCPRSGTRHVARDLAEHLGMDVAFGVEFVELPDVAGPGVCEHGNAVLSRLPMYGAAHAFYDANVSWYLPPDQRPGDEPRLGGRSWVMGEVWAGDDWLRVVSLHLESRPEGWGEVLPAQAEEAAGLGLERSRAIVGGDTNSPGYQLDVLRGDGEVRDPTGAAFVDRGYVDSHAALPADGRATRGGFIIDLMFGRGLTFSGPAVCDDAVCSGLSDHEAIWATAGW